MKCPFCDSKQVFVTNSRPTKSMTVIWRRRRCQLCQGVFSTYEKIDLSYLILIKKSGKRVRYNRAKLYSGIYQAAAAGKKMDRGDAGDLAEKITQEIEEEIISLKKKIIETQELSGIVLNTLKEKYPAIFLRYMAYFVNIPEQGSLKRELKKYI